MGKKKNNKIAKVNNTVNRDNTEFYTKIALGITIISLLFSIVYVFAGFEKGVMGYLKIINDNTIKILELSPINIENFSQSTVIGEVRRFDDVEIDISTNKYYFRNLENYNSFNICLVNQSFEDWSEFGKIPSKKDFLLLINTQKNEEISLETKCVVLDYYNDPKNRNEMLIVSDKIFKQLVFDESDFTVNNFLFVKLSELEKSQWKSDKECIELLILFDKD